MYGRFSVTSPDKASLPPGSCAPLAAVSPSLTLVEVMSIITSWKAAVSSACLCVCSAIFSLNFRGLEAPEPVPELGPGPGPQPLEPVADIFTERTERLDVVEWFFPPEDGPTLTRRHTLTLFLLWFVFLNRPICYCQYLLFTWKWHTTFSEWLKFKDLKSLHDYFDVNIR